MRHDSPFHGVSLNFLSSQNPRRSRSRFNPAIARAWLALSITLLTGKVFGENAWPQFRGLNASGIGEHEKPPAEFGPGTNEVFRTAIPPGASSPCVWGDRIFLTAFEDGKLETLCLDRRDGKLLWKKVSPTKTIESFHPAEGSPAASTPATDGERVYTYFGSCGLVAFDMDGKQLWQLSMPPAQHVGDFGTGTSPIVNSGIVVLNRDMVSGSHIVAVNAKTGKIVWRQERPEFFSSYSTPIVWEHDGAAEVVVAGVQRLKAYHLRTGVETWQAGGLPNAACTTPVIGEGMLLFAGWSPGPKEIVLPQFGDLLDKLDNNKDGGLQKDELTSQPFVASLFSFCDMNGDGKLTQQEWESRMKLLSQGENALMAVRPGKGDITYSNVAWKQTRGLPYVPSPLFYKGLVYLVKDGGMVSCFDAKTGKPHYEQERIGDTSSYYSSPVAADGRIFMVSVSGKVTVFNAGEKASVIARTALGERCVATPAIVDDTLYYRTANHLWAFGKPKKK